uniref:Uncharacterized protein n=1 Tax=Pyrodinium bahamense TaxID=73915 RepID=A0A7R9ZZP4_9DINO
MADDELILEIDKAFWPRGVMRGLTPVLRALGDKHGNVVIAAQPTKGSIMVKGSAEQIEAVKSELREIIEEHFPDAPVPEELLAEGEGGAAEEEQEEEEQEEEAFWHLSSSLWHCLGEGEWPSFIVMEGAVTIKRMVDLAVNTMSFSFAFCFLYATQWWLAQIFLNEEAALSMVLAMVITVCSCFMLYVLDRMADESEEASASHGGVEKEDKVNRKLMEGIAILIGFVWEQSFDGALEGVAEKGNLWLKPLLGLLTALVILPVWFWYIMPMETEAGYIIGLMPRAIKTRVANINFVHEPWLRKEVNAQVKEMLVVLCEEKVLELSNDILSALKVDQSSKYKPPTPLESG